MLKTDQNLKGLEKRIRLAAKLIQDLKKTDAPNPRGRQEKAFEDLPLLKDVDRSRATPELARLLKEREIIRDRIGKILQDIEQVIR